MEPLTQADILDEVTRKYFATNELNILTAISSEDQWAATNFCIEAGLMKVNCPCTTATCTGNMKWIKDSSTSDGRLQCDVCKKRPTVRSLSAFNDSKLTTREILSLVHGVVQGKTQEQMKNLLDEMHVRDNKNKRVSSATISDFCCFVAQKSESIHAILFCTIWRRRRNC
eukprot:Phypoly_transcript_22570.p1 GENE.Phypoly_transcript_22570~~Phypoly_transcript_22570.p1  ORF type:complete len:170 (+),score=11.19 Phypoly_transcript_22570:40-549(+)